MVHICLLCSIRSEFFIHQKAFDSIAFETEDIKCILSISKHFARVPRLCQSYSDVQPLKATRVPLRYRSGIDVTVIKCCHTVVVRGTVSLTLQVGLSGGAYKFTNGDVLGVQLHRAMRELVQLSCAK